MSEYFQFLGHLCKIKKNTLNKHGQTCIQELTQESEFRSSIAKINLLIDVMQEATLLPCRKVRTRILGSNIPEAQVI